MPVQQVARVGRGRKYRGHTFEGYRRRRRFDIIPGMLSGANELDPLTGVQSRRALFQRLQALRPGESVAAIGVDVRGLRGINDELGPAAGDELLVNVARRLAGATYAGDVVSRLLGPEFAVLAYCVGGDSDELEMLTREVADAVTSQPVELGSDSIDVRASIACAMLESVDDLGLIFPGD